MPATIAALRSGINDALSTVYTMRHYEELPNSPVTPCSLTSLVQIQFDSTFCRGADDYEFLVVVLVGRANDRNAQVQVEAALAGTGTGSIKTALEADPTLGGICGAVRVPTASGIRTYERPDGTALLGAEFTVFLSA